VDKIKIAFVASTFSVGGSEKVMYEVITRLPGGRFDSRLFFLRGAGTIGEVLFAQGFRGMSRLQMKRIDATVLPRLTSVFKKYSPDILFMLDHRNAMFWGGLASLLARVPARVIASHSTGKYGGKKSFSRLDKIFMRATNAVIALSNTHANYLAEKEGIKAGKIHIIENGIDFESYESIESSSVEALRNELGIKGNEKVVIMVAALRPEKAHEVLLQAAEALLGSIPQVRFIIAGDGPRREHLQGMAAGMQLGDRVTFLGERNDVARLLKLSDVFVLPSHPVVETLPLSVLEAMASGLPVIASSVGSVPEVVEDGVTGILIPSGDASALAEAITQLLSNRHVASAMAKRAQRLVKKRFSVARMIEDYCRLFEEVYESTYG
jgi:glycosyltransferase involved in cell wall biosynthesis